MKRRMSAVMACAVLVTTIAEVAAARGANTQTSDATGITFPPLTITGTTVTADVTYDPSRGVYRYVYTVAAPATNKAPVAGIQIDVSGRVARQQTDPALSENVQRRRQLQPQTAIPVGITTPDPSFWGGGVGKGSSLYVSTFREGGGILPGATFNFVVESRLPPGARRATISPSIQPWLDFIDALPEDADFEEPIKDSFNVSVMTVGPSDPDLSTLFDGGGQSPAEVNPFLRYVAPTESRTKLPAGTSSTWVIVAYGQTTDPATFTAELNGADVRTRFHPAPGAIEAVKFDLASGTSKVQLSIQGRTSSGRVARDTDTLTFIVP